MTTFSNFLAAILLAPSSSTVLEINGSKRHLKAFVHLTSQNSLKEGGDYYKMLFTDHSFLLIIPKDEEIYYADKLLGEITDIPDQDIGVAKTIFYQGKDYELTNKDDYQFVLELLVGSPLDIEGECLFSDYFPTSGPKEFLSLGWLSRNGERADINCRIIDQNCVNIINSK